MPPDRSGMLTPMATVLLVDDDPTYRRALGAFLDASYDIDVVGDTGDGHEAVGLAERLRPDAVVIDIAMPGINGVDVAEQIRGILPGVAIVLVTGVDGGEEHRRAQELGVGQLLPKGDPLPVENALRTLTRRQRP
jgi:two-component system, NarL family, response regulator DesR